MFGTIWRLAIAGGLAAAVFGSMLITGHLRRLEAGLEQNVKAAMAPVEVQKAIRDRNEIIVEMTQTAGRIGTGLDGVLARSEAIAHQASLVGEANRATVELNRQMVQQNDLAAADLSLVLQSLQQMNLATDTMRQYLGELARTAWAEAADLDAIAATTARMAVKTPDFGR